MGALDKIQSANDTQIRPTLDYMAERIKKRGLVILISDLLDDPGQVLMGLNHFRHNKQEMIVFHLLDRQELEFQFGNRTKFRDLETDETITTEPWHIRSAYQELIEMHQRKYRLGCRNQRIDYVPLFTDQPLDLALNEYLNKRQKTG
jgi:hypothetical protein